ncbi:hypothetical protein ACIQZG_22100 [Lysinibacillus sp. NPDC096418]|uniref:hypothetical protein n=1 Tax=Lysinibacillus sp. NPDC096418 TaxID=3364138 RepID=UPI0038055671
MNRGQLQELMLMSFENISRGYIQRGFIDTTSYESYKAGVNKWIIGATSPSFTHKRLYVTVDYAAGAGRMVGSPTNRTHITVICSDKLAKTEIFERFSINKLLELFWQQEFFEKQLTLF